MSDTPGTGPAGGELCFEIEGRDVAFEIDEELYPRDAIYGAGYLFLDRAYVLLSRPRAGTVRVRLRSQSSAPSEQELEALAGTFANELLNQVLRLRIGAATAPLRQQIFARAFPASGTDRAIAELLAELDREELEEEPLEIAVPWEIRNAPGEAAEPKAEEPADG